MKRSALVVGVTGMAGYSSAIALQDKGFEVIGMSRSPKYELPGVTHVYADVLDPESIRAAIDGLTITDVVFATWQRQDTEAENCRVNGEMLQNTLDVVCATNQLVHATLITGLKHYLGPFEAYGKGSLPPTPFREELPRLPVENFYYAQEDAVF